MATPRGRFEALMALTREFVAQRNRGHLSGVDLLVEFCGELREFLDVHDASDEERRVVVALLIGRFVTAEDLSAETKREILDRCGEALGVEIRRTH